MICLSENGGLTQMAISIGKIVMNDWIEWATVIFRQSYLNWIWIEMIEAPNFID